MLILFALRDTDRLDSFYIPKQRDGCHKGAKIWATFFTLNDFIFYFGQVRLTEKRNRGIHTNRVQL